MALAREHATVSPTATGPALSGDNHLCTYSTQFLTENCIAERPDSNLRKIVLFYDGALCRIMHSG